MTDIRIMARLGRRGVRTTVALIAVAGWFGPASIRTGAAQDVQPQIADEIPGGGAERVYFRYDQDPNVTLASYAAVNFSGCSGTMIGPNLLLTAGHCGPNRGPIWFRAYRSATSTVTEVFNCDYLLQTFPDTDLLLEYCGPNAAGVNPGDKYGYLDLDIEVARSGQFLYTASRDRANASRDVYSIWTNPITDLGISDAMLYSEGRVQSITAAPHWYNPNATDPCGPTADGRPLGVDIDMWSNPGASGSSHLSRDRHRILHGPLSVGAADARGPAARGMLSIADYLHWGRVFSPSDPPCGSATAAPQLNREFLESLGLTPERYTSWVDANVDGVFDVQKDLEILRGEARRDWYWLGFESNRRNVLWTRGGNVGFDLTNATTILDARSAPDTSYQSMLRHGSLNLKPNTYYVVSVSAFLRQAASPLPLRIQLAGNLQTFSLPIGRWQKRVARLWSGSSPNPSLSFQVAGQADLSLSSVTVIEDNARMDFDTHDERVSWTNDATKTRAFIWPNGNDSGTTSNWAGVVQASGSPTTWSLTNRHLGIRDGQMRMCFDHQMSSRNPLQGGRGIVRVLQSSGVARGTMNFVPLASWQRACSKWFTVTGSDNKLMFGTQSSLPSVAKGGYLVDNIAIVRR